MGISAFNSIVAQVSSNIKSSEILLRKVNNYTDVTSNVGIFSHAIESVNGIDSFSTIRIRGGKGRMYLEGIAWTNNRLQPTGNLGSVHADLLVGPLNPSNIPPTLLISSNVGIGGIVNPFAALDVSGDAQVSGTLSTSNLNFTGTLFQNGTAYVGSQWTTSNAGSTITYSGNAQVSGQLSAASFADASGNALMTTPVTPPWSTDGAVAFRRDDGQALAVGAGGALSSRYFWLGGMVVADVRMTLGTMSALGTASNAWCWTLPVEAAAVARDGAIGTALLRDAAGHGCYSGTAFCMPDGLSAKVFLETSSDTGVTLDLPFAWQAGDSVSLKLSYEALGVQLAPGVTPVAFQQQTSRASLGLGMLPDAGITSNSFVVKGSFGVGGISAPAYPLDVSGVCRASYFVDPSGNRLLANAAARWSTGACAFKRDDGAALSVGSGGSLTCRYFWFGAMVTAEIKMVVGGSGANLGISSQQGWCWTLPVPPAATSMDANIGTALLRHVSGGTPGVHYTGVAFSTADGTAVKVGLESVSTTGVSPLTPFAWAAGDSISLLLSYEASGVQQPAYVVPVGLTQSATAGSNCLGLGLAPGAAAPLSSFVVAGSVGIGGISTPSATLDVSGSIHASNVYISGQLTSSNVVTGAVYSSGQLTSSNVVTGGLCGCITDSLTTTSSVWAASATALSNVNAAALSALSNVNAAALSALSNVNAVAAAALPKAGGTVVGALTILGHLFTSNVSVMGAMEIVNAYETHTSNLVIVNTGPGPALSVTQTESTAQPVAAFYAGSNLALMVTSAGQVGIGKSSASCALDVSGGVNVSSNIVVANPCFFYSDLQSYSLNTTISGNSTVLVPFATNSTIYNQAFQSGFNNSTNSYTIQQSGVWQFNICIHCWGASANQNVIVQLYKNGSVITYTQAYFPMLSTGYDEGCVVAPIVRCALNDVISVYFTNNGSTTINYRWGNVRLSYFYGQLICS